MTILELELREHPALRRLVAAVQDWRATTEIVAHEEALRRYNEAAATLIGLGVTLPFAGAPIRMPDHGDPTGLLNAARLVLRGVP